MRSKALVYVGLLYILALATYTANAQTQFWIENWTGTTCVQGCTSYTGTNGTWTINTTLGTNGSGANTWFFSQQEAAMGRTKCGTVNGTVTAHVGNVSTSPNAWLYCPSGDCGAAYDAGDCGGAVVAHTRLESPTINCTGKSTITLTLNYIMNGDASDLCTPYYYDGSTWTALTAFTAKICPLGQGKWQFYSVSLPASANNNANVKVGFYWVNDDDCADFSDADPSFAVDSIRLLYSVILPIQLTSFTADYNHTHNLVDIKWATATETDNALFTIQRSTDGEAYTTVTTVKGAGNSSEAKYYSAVDSKLFGGTVYYRLMQTDYDGHSSYSQIVPVNEDGSAYLKVFPDPATTDITLSYSASAAGETGNIGIYDCTGRLMKQEDIAATNKGANTYVTDIASLAKGIYLLKLNMQGKVLFAKFVKK